MNAKKNSKYNTSKILLVSEKINGFYRKYLTKLIYELKEKGYDILLMIGDNDKSINMDVEKVINKDFNYFSKSYDEHRFIEVFKEAEKNNIARIHFCRIIDPQRLFLALNTYKRSNIFTITFSVFGLSEYLRRPIYANYIEKLLKINVINAVLLHTIYPKLIKKVCTENNYYNSPKVFFIHDPIYENDTDYNISKVQAREDLNLNKSHKIILYFGAYFLSKGPDILCNAATQLKDIENIDFIFVGDTSTASFYFRKEQYLSKNIFFDDRFVDDETAIKYLVAADLVVLPYRKYYEYNTSGILVQSCLAKTPLLVPDIYPFADVVKEFHIGSIFKCESVSSLKNQIVKFIQRKSIVIEANFDNYLQNVEGWNEIAEIIIKK